jgi:hypothetical protein
MKVAFSIMRWQTPATTQFSPTYSIIVYLWRRAIHGRLYPTITLFLKDGNSQLKKYLLEEDLTSPNFLRIKEEVLRITHIQGTSRIISLLMLLA